MFCTYNFPFNVSPPRRLCSAMTAIKPKINEMNKQLTCYKCRKFSQFNVKKNL